jgi:putative transposase
MGVKERPWQDIRYPLGYFGRTPNQAKKAYLNFMEQGISLGKRQDLTGGGLIRSIGGWTEVKQRGLDHVMSDERVLGDSAFVEDLLSQADEQYERRYQLKRLGYDADRIAGKVAKIYDMDPDEFFSKGKQQRKVKARSLFCFWAVKELGMSLRELARRLEMSPPAVGYAVERGETIARENEYRLID